MADKDGWNDSGRPDENPTIDICLRRAAWSLQTAYKGRVSKGGEVISDERKTRLIGFGNSYATLAIALQKERDYEQREIQRIATLAKGGEDAEMRPDEPDGVRDRVELQHEELPGEDLPPGRRSAHL